MNNDLLDFDDWGRFVRSGLLLVVALALGVFLVVTLALWVHGVVSDPVLSRTTTAVIAQPRSASGWLVLAVIPGALSGLGALALGLLLLCLLAVLAILRQGLEARRVAATSIANLSAQARHAAESGIGRGRDAT